MGLEYCVREYVIVGVGIKLVPPPAAITSGPPAEVDFETDPTAASHRSVCGGGKVGRKIGPSCVKIGARWSPRVTDSTTLRVRTLTHFLKPVMIFAAGLLLDSLSLVTAPPMDSISAMRNSPGVGP